MGFSTVENVNGAMFDNQGFWVCEIDLPQITTGTEDYNNVKIDFCTVSREKLSNGKYQFTVVIDNPLWSNTFYLRRSNGNYIPVGYVSFNKNSFPLKFTIDYSDVILLLYMGVLKTTSNISFKQDYIVGGDEVNVTYDRINKPYNVRIRTVDDDFPVVTTINSLTVGYHLIKRPNVDVVAGYLFVRLLKTDFQFSCNQDLTVGEVNTVSLGTLTDYKPNGDLVGEYETKISVLYNNKTIPVVWNNALNDYTFDLDLTGVQSTGKVRFTVLVEANEVLNRTETEVVLNRDYQGINSISKLQILFKNGGTGRLTGNLTFNNDLTINNGVTLLGDANTINLNGYKIVVGNGLTFKADAVLFTNGVNSIQQQTGTNVELTDCIFTDCNGFGSVIDCQVDINNLNDEDDFRTILTRCNISNSDMMILHGGHLEITECKITGKISNKNYPYCLYQTDGSANIHQTEFKLVDGTVYDYDLLFNPCIFTVGENATVNGLSHSDLQTNHVPTLLGDARNTSIIDVTYYYNLIEDTINLNASNGFCHSVSGEDFVFKTNIILKRV